MLELELERPAGFFLHLMTKLIPVPRHVVEAHGEAWTDPANLVSNGPFQLDSYKSGKSINLVRNMDYHGRFLGNLQEIELKLNLESCDALEMYGSNEIDIVILDTETYYARYRYIGEYISEPWPGTYFVGFDTSRPPFDDLRVRRAFAMAVDKQNLADEVLAGYRYAATGGLVPPGMPGHSPGIGLPYDPDQARQELAQAGYPDGHGFPNLEIAWIDVSTLEFLKDQLLGNLNIEITIRVMQWADILNKLYSWNVFILGWNHNYPDPDDFLRTCVRGNLHHWRNEIYDRLLDEARRITNQDERITLYQEADKILMDEATVIPCMYMGNHILVKPWVRIPGGGTGIWHIKDVIIEPH
jgi:oligopeptide transport system substrate-binding protein